VEVEGGSVLTIEGLAKDGKLHPVQKSFVEHGAIQCGFCTPGAVMAAKALLDKKPNPTEEEVRRGLAGNICRCTGYVKIIEAVLASSKKMNS
jgi:carbon-monoxide dehydrogenase small subunit